MLLCLGTSAAGSQSSFLCIQLQRNSTLQCRNTAIKPRLTGFWNELIFIIPFHFTHFPQSQTLHLYKTGPIGKPCPSCGGHNVSALDVETHLLFHVLFSGSMFLEKMPEGFIRAALHLWSCFHISCNWNGYPQRVELHPVSARQVT